MVKQSVLPFQGVRAFLAYMQLVTPRVVPMAVSTAMSICKIVFQTSFFISFFLSFLVVQHLERDRAGVHPCLFPSPFFSG